MTHDGTEGQRVGPYVLEEHVGSGGMGEVFRARDERLGRQVALKHLRPDHTDSPQRRARLRREAWAVAQLNHPGIVQIYDVLEASDGDWIVMEWVPGETLETRIARRQLDAAETIELTRQVAKALAAAHNRGVIHRDLKTANIMVGDDGQAKILDFGLAKSLDRDSSVDTRSGAVMGTAHAMSPEQARGRTVDYRSDLFSLGSMIHEMTTGQAPFRGTTLADTLTRICTSEPPRLDEIRDDLPRSLADLVEHLLAKMPEARPASAKDVAARLERMEPSVSLRSHPDPDITLMDTIDDTPSVDDDAPRRTIPVGLIGAVLAVVIAVWLVSFFSAAPDMPTLTTATKKSGTEPQTSATPASPFDHYRQGRELLARHDRPGHIDDAIEAFEAALALDPTYAPAEAGLARAFWRQYRAKPDPYWLDRAARRADRALELDPELTFARVVWAQTRMLEGEHDAARARLDEVIRTDPAYAEAYRALADFERTTGNADAARQAFEQAITLDRTNWEYPFELASLELDQGNQTRAEDLLERSLELAPDNAFAYFSLGAIAYFRGDFAAAAQRFQRSIEINPSPAAYSNLGTLYFFQGLYTESVRAFERAVELGAHGLFLWANLGDAYRWSPGRESDARDAYTRAIQLLEPELDKNPDDLQLRSRLALLLAKRGDTDDALAQADRVGAAEQANILYRLTITHELTGQRERALEMLERAIGAGYPLVEIERDPELTALREDADYHRLLARGQRG
ncbi:MAG: protein kinase [Acidobacteriota bacterium]